MKPRPARVYLPMPVARCPGTGCHKAGGCARALTLHEYGRPMEDLTRSAGWTPANGCSYFVNAADYRQPAAAAPQEPKDYVEGLL